MRRGIGDVRELITYTLLAKFCGTTGVSLGPEGQTGRQEGDQIYYTRHPFTTAGKARLENIRKT
jgi:hypothetical protein